MKSQSLRLFLLIFFLIGIFNFSYAQEHFVFPASKADVLDDAPVNKFNKLPELKSVNGELTAHLFINEEVYNFAGTPIKMRTYTYESGNKKYKRIGPWGPTLRIGQNDRLNIILHNNLPYGKDKNYLGSMALEHAGRLRPGRISGELAKILVKSTTHINRDGSDTTLIQPENLKVAILKVIEPGKLWHLIGQEVCKCPPGQKGTCTKQEVIYPIERKFNYGTSQKEALRIYKYAKHGPEHDHNIPHGFNTTNMHTHGFHVSPFQDDIFRKVPAGNDSYYTYQLDNHTPGTMWYHPHVHGSTALQVASGMSGVIIIEDPDLSNFPDLAAASIPEHERIMVFNQIVYDTITGELPDFNTLLRVGESPKGTTINGVPRPLMEMERGEVQRWRLIHSGYTSTLALHFPKEIEVRQIAVDGIMFKESKKVRSIHMAPGNRMDILVKAPKNAKDSTTFKISSIEYDPMCEYFVNKRNFTTSPPKNSESMMQIMVVGDRPEMGLPNRLPGPVGHPDIGDRELTNLGNPRRTEFSVKQNPDKDFLFKINDKRFKGDTIHETLTLGTAEEWELTSTRGSHPYHIHINPFQVVEFGGKKVDPPMWKDVVMVPNNNQKVMIRSRYTTYWGDFVLHCHLLHHEDQGMMQRIRIKRPLIRPTIHRQKTNK